MGVAYYRQGNFFITKQTFTFQVFLRRNAFLTARGSSQGSRLAGGGVIQIRSEADVLGICESKFNVDSGTLGLVNVLGEWRESV